MFKILRSSTNFFVCNQTSLYNIKFSKFFTKNSNFFVEILTIVAFWCYYLAMEEDMEENKQTVEKEEKIEKKDYIVGTRVKLEPKKWPIVVTTVLTAVLFFAGLLLMCGGNMMLDDGMIATGGFFAGVDLFMPISIYILAREYNYNLEAFTYPNEVFLLDGDAFDVVTDKVEVIKFADIDRVIGRRFTKTQATGLYYKTTTYTYGTITIILKNGKKRVYKNVAEVLDTAQKMNLLIGK